MPPATDAEGNAKLLPLPRAIAVPPGAAARSSVPAVRYDLAVSGTGEQAPDDGVPDDGPREIFERGGASWYGIQFHQRKTASGERFDMTAMTAAHKTLPFNTRVCVRSLVNGSEVLVRINDRGPYAAGRVIDLSRAAADRIGLTGLGIKQVALTVIDRDGMRCGGLQVEASDAAAPAASSEPQQQRARTPAPARRKAAVPPRRRK
ncbi:septal ring lytic transglycosylase RlpA family protein [Variovorax sp. NFACC27]|uniref:septal ring lytic transglycosylase RlpA family protein n=1 Tax=unclassified Variovorax TaxID=663243 RepID=UPI0008969E5F|nr:septal ring lytic transglycosylase RlpA family protein [Variovorax sp. YR750]SEF29623.1 rare lipoprotein A [Variovorax sp. NFACC28]SEG93896.1 rare lipoprotein A [Variovorax sp. NFACC29]SFD59176.1 rare lipoprotein A [Variovorax sp. NFACC26]SFG89288.1 rare lipoprotein A [Variovorax sp. NFACC27]SEL99810.1 rare lipoprotein A [Variovorax sp. YR750]